MRKMRKEEDRKNNTHVAKLMFIGYFSTAIFVALIFRLFYLQVIKHDFYTTEINKQMMFTIPVDMGRGEIFDRNNIPLVNRGEKKFLMVFPHLFVSSDKNIELISDVTKLSKGHISTRLTNAKNPVEFPVDADVNWKEKRIVETRGVFVINKIMRYEDNQLLSHVIGYMHNIDKKGLSGIERSYDYVLSGAPNKSVIAILDGRKRILPGEGLSIVNNSMSRNNVKLTIDYRIQKITEDVLDESGELGVVVITDVNTGEILSMASRPTFNPNDMKNHLQSTGDELYNKAVQMTFPPGSIFKIVLAAEALEKGLVDPEELFYCNGIETVGNQEIKCTSLANGGNGEINLETAFAKSCNSTFVQLGRRIGAENIIKMAKRLGLGEKTNIGFLEEESGVLPSGDQLVGPSIGNISIGQGEIDVTPIQVNQLTQIIANKGVKKPLSIVKAITDDKNNIIEEPKIDESTRVLPEDVAIELQKYMSAVMKNGTGTSVGDSLKEVTAGKTGTAESSYKNSPVLHAWFTGYYPNNEPKYAVTVFVQDGKSGGGVAVPIFRDIINRIMKEE